MYTVVFHGPQAGGMRFGVKGMRWAAEGGPKGAALEARVGAGQVDWGTLAGLAGCPVEIYGPEGNKVWWGLVWDVVVEDGAVEARVSLDDLANRVRVVYGEARPEVMGTGRRATTAWAEDAASQAEYGVKEGQFELSLASAEQAERYRDGLLARLARPAARAGVVAGAKLGQGVRIRLGCRGWWETLAWKRYHQVAGLIENVAAGAPPECTSFGTAERGDLAQRIVAATGGWVAEVVWVALRRVNYATGGSISVALCAGGAAPGGVLASATLDGGTLPVSNPGWVALRLSVPVVMYGGYDYWIRVGREGEGSASSYFRALVDPGRGYPAGELLGWDVGAGAWAELGGADLQFRLAGRMETGEQIRWMGRAFFGVVRTVASGLWSNPYRNGDRDAKTEIEALLRAGTGANRRLLGEVTGDLALVVREQPEEARYRVGRDGVIRLLSGQAARPGPGVAGEWAETGWGRVWLEEVGWEGERGGIAVGA